MPGQLFGTDGVRGHAGDFLTAELALQLARAAVLHGGHERRLVEEPREPLLHAFARGLRAERGKRVVDPARGRDRVALCDVSQRVGARDHCLGPEGGVLRPCPGACEVEG